LNWITPVVKEIFVPGPIPNEVLIHRLGQLCPNSVLLNVDIYIFLGNLSVNYVILGSRTGIGFVYRPFQDFIYDPSLQPLLTDGSVTSVQGSLFECLSNRASEFAFIRVLPLDSAIIQTERSKFSTSDYKNDSFPLVFINGRSVGLFSPDVDAYCATIQLGLEHIEKRAKLMALFNREIKDFRSKQEILEVVDGVIIPKDSHTSSSSALAKPKDHLSRFKGS